MLNALILAALSVVPVYTNHNRVAGNVKTMTNIQAWAEDVETAIGHVGITTNAVCNLITNNVAPWAMAGKSEPQGMTGATATNIAQNVVRDDVRTNYLCTVAAAQAKADAARDQAKATSISNGGNDESSIYWFNDTLYFNGLSLDLWTIVANEVILQSWDTIKANYESLPEFVSSTSVTNLGAVAAATNAAVAQAMAQADEKFLPLTGGTLSGTLFGTVFVGERFSASSFRDAYLGDIKFQAMRSGADYESYLSPDGSPVVTSNMMNDAVMPKIEEWETYWRGDRVRLSVTNYYGNTSGELPRLRIEEFDHSTTTTVDNVQIISNFFHTVWDETDRQTNYMAKTDAKVSAISNAVMESAWRQTNLQLANKAPRAWQTVTSAGEDAPPNMVWHTAPQSVFAGGTEYAHVAVGEGSISVLVDKGAPVYTDGAEGQFRFQDQSGQNYFGFDVRSAYKIGCRTDGISVDPAQHIVSLTYDLTSATNPNILQSTNLVDWADAEVTWEQNPPAGTKVCYIDVGTQPKGFYQAEIRYAGGSKFLTNMQADLMGGIAASNQTLNIVQSVEPYIVSNQVMWRVKQ